MEPTKYMIREDDYDKSFIISGVTFNSVEEAQRWIKREFNIPHSADETGMFFVSFFPNGDRRDFYIEKVPTAKELNEAIEHIENCIKDSVVEVFCEKGLKQLKNFVELMA